MKPLPEYAGISLGYHVQPAEVCGGVWVDAEQRFVPVAITKLYRYNSHDTRYTLWEYATQSTPQRPSEVRACLLRTYPYSSSATWYIKPEAAADNYYESHRTISGNGHLVGEDIGFDQNGMYAKAIGAIALPASGETIVLPGMAFSIVQPNNIFSPGAREQSSLNVLATYPGAPFLPDYEQRI